MTEQNISKYFETLKTNKMGNELVPYKSPLWKVNDDVISIPLELTGLSGGEIIDILNTKGVKIESLVRETFLASDSEKAVPRPCIMKIIKGVALDGLYVPLEHSREEAILRSFESPDLELIARFFETISFEEIIKMGLSCIIFMTETFYGGHIAMPYYLAIDCLGDTPELTIFWAEESMLTSKYDGYVFMDFAL